MSDLIDRQAAIDVVHKAIFDLFDICDDDEESPMTYKDMQLLEVNKAISTQIKELPSAQPEYYDYSDIDAVWEYYAEEQDINLTDGAKQLKDAMWVGYRKGKQNAQQWIPCSERLPEKGNEVLVCYDFKGHRSVLIGTLYSDEKFHGFDDEYLTPEGRKYRKAVAWMPLPTAYWEEGEKQ